MLRCVVQTSLSYTAPEVLQMGNSTATDMYAFGVLMGRALLNDWSAEVTSAAAARFIFAHLITSCVNIMFF